MAGPRKTIDQKIEEIDQKIAFHEDKIDALKKKKDELLCPISYQDIINEAKRQRIPPQKPLVHQFRPSSMRHSLKGSDLSS